MLAVLLVSDDPRTSWFFQNWGLKLQQSYTQAGNIQYNLIHRYNVTDYNALTFRGANIGINTTTPISKLHITHSSTSLQADAGAGQVYM